MSPDNPAVTIADRIGALNTVRVLVLGATARLLSKRPLTSSATATQLASAGPTASEPLEVVPLHTHTHTHTHTHRPVFWLYLSVFLTFIHSFLYPSFHFVYCSSFTLSFYSQFVLLSLYSFFILSFFLSSLPPPPSVFSYFSVCPPVSLVPFIPSPHSTIPLHHNFHYIKRFCIIRPFNAHFNTLSFLEHKQ
jgi:hypothetical protein